MTVTFFVGMHPVNVLEKTKEAIILLIVLPISCTSMQCHRHGAVNAKAESGLHLPHSALPPGLMLMPPSHHHCSSHYHRYACFSIMSSSSCRKRKLLLQPNTLKHSNGDSSLSNALHFLNEIPMPYCLSQIRERRGGEKTEKRINGQI